MAARGNAKTEIFEMLKQDHREVKKAFKQFEKLDPEDDQEDMEALVKMTCAALEVHAQLEEELFYPAAREAMKSADLIDEAEVEHMSARALIETLKGMDAQDEKYAATFTVLGEYTKHHIKEEESEMFGQLERARIDWQSLLQEMQERRQALEQEMGLTEASSEESEEQDKEEETEAQPAPRQGGESRAAPRGRRSSVRGA